MESPCYNIFSAQTFGCLAFLSSLIAFLDKITGDYKSGFRCNRSNIDQIFFIR
jgi:hypothetical protein